MAASDEKENEQIHLRHGIALIAFLIMTMVIRIRAGTGKCRHFFSTEKRF